MLFRSLTGGGGDEEHLPSFSLFGEEGAGDPAGEPREPAGEQPGRGEEAAGPGELLPLLLLLPTEFFGWMGWNADPDPSGGGDEGEPRGGDDVGYGEKRFEEPEDADEDCRRRSAAAAAWCMNDELA